ncbi:uncharacterized protein LOC5504174 [Nematostella vectensis]|uniref:uncharacterized protein LOC5504174 n=1 Tax=Nematostella vectensis TaxID=45351 RepID=UPI0020772FE3|nr:uncharacterized protein LOC5504174 [Nematostella vectensis]
MDDDAALRESVSNLRDAILLGRSDIIRSILSTAAEFREEGELFGDDEDNDPLARQRYFEEYTDPYDILKLILNYVDSDAGTCLHLATKMGFADGVRSLLAAGADPTITNNEGATPFDYCTDKSILGVYNEELLQAAAGANIPRVRRLLKAGVSANASDGAATDNKVLHWAASFGTPEVIALLCENGADTNCLNANGSTPLHDAVTREDLEVIQTLLNYGADTGIIAKSGPLEGKSALDLASTDELETILASSTKVKAKPLQNGEIHEPSDVDSSDSVETISQLPSPPPVTIKQLSAKTNSATFIDPKFFHLWPSPQRIQEISGTRFFPSSTVPVYIERSKENLSELTGIWETLGEKFEQAGHSLDIKIITVSEEVRSPPGSIRCQLCPSLFHRTESYRIHVTEKLVLLVASEAVSLWYAVNTVLQMLRVFNNKGIPQSRISDWPDVKHRGILLDVSTGRVPKMETLMSLVDILSSAKVNQLQLYMQNTFAFEGHESVSRNSTPYTQSDIIKLDEYCRRRYIELVPHIESLSGFHRWFVYKQYTHLAESHTDVDTSIESPVPRSLCPSNDDCISLSRGLHDQAFPCFASTRFAHVGVDVTEEFGRGQSYVMAQAKGEQELYLSYLRAMYRSCRKHGRTMQFWANPLHDEPAITLNLPCDVIAMEYGDKPGYDFMKQCRTLSDEGVSFYVCPGTLTWNSACANTDDSLTLTNNAVQAAIACDALGVLTCDWSLPGHVNPLCMSIPAFLATAGLSWKADTDLADVKSLLPEIVSTHALLDNSAKIGHALCDLGRVHAILTNDLERAQDDWKTSGVHPLGHDQQGTLIWRVLSSGGETDLRGVTLDSVQQATRHIRQCQNTIMTAELKCAHGLDILKELDTTADLILFACRICRTMLLAQKQNTEVKSVRDLPAINRTDLANRLLGLIEHYQKVYLLQNRSGGLLSAKQQLEKILQKLLPETPSNS